jgi:hypothetical protein
MRLCVISGNSERHTDSDENCTNERDVVPSVFTGNEIIYLECPAIKDFYAVSAFPLFKHGDADEEACHIWETPKTHHGKNVPHLTEESIRR